MLSLRRTAQKLAGTQGAEIAEAALVLPLAFMFLLGIIWFGRAFNIYSTITQAAQQGAIAAARDTCATCPPLSTDAARTKVDSTVVAVLTASSLDTGEIQQSAKPALLPCPLPAPQGSCAATSHHIMVCSSVLLNSTTQPAQCGTWVGFQYPFQFYLPFTSLNMQKITMTAQAQSRMEN